MDRSPDELPTPVAARLVDELMAGLGQGTWTLGDRMPSVRALARDRRVSITSVLSAYARLEGRGLISRRPRSGLFVARLPANLSPPAVSRPSSRVAAPTTVDLEALAAEVLAPDARRTVAAFGAAVPPPELLPLTALAGHLRRVLAGGTDWARYADPAGVPGLRVAISRRMLSSGARVPPEEVVVTTGAMEALTLALRATCRPGDVVAIESPMFFGILQLIGSLGLRVVEIPTHPRDGMLIDALREALDEHPVRAVLAITNFSNPLGSCMPEAAKRELIGLLAERDIPLIEDDIYGELAHHGQRPGLARAADGAGRVLVCGSFSKCLSPGLRVGWIAGGRYAVAIRHLKMTSTFASTTLPQLAVADYLEQGGFDRHLRRLRATIGRRCGDLADAVLAAFPEGTRTTRPSGGFCLWVELPATVDAVALHRLALADGIVLAPGHLFSAKRRYQHFIRLNAAAYTAALAPQVRQLGRLAAHLLRAG